MKKKHPETNSIRKQINKTQYREHASPLFMTSSFVFESAEQAQALFADEIEGNIYTRFSNPNNAELADKLVQLEEAEAGLVTASGMAAMFCSMAAMVHTGDHILASRSLFGSTYQILTQIFPRWGIETTFLDAHEPEKWESLIQKNTKLIFVESPSNPGLDLIDLEFLGNLAQSYQLTFIVDNCFSTPYLQKPVRFGAHVVTHSTTKFIDGQGRTIGGAIVGEKELIEKVKFFNRHTGPTLSPLNAWILSKSLETLHIRMDKHCSNAFELSNILQQNEHVLSVKYPFLESHPQFELAKKQMKLGGGIVTIRLKGGIERMMRFCNHLKMISLTSNLGDTRTIITPPAITTHSKLSPEERKRVGIADDMVRISVGLENVEDIYSDIGQALLASR